MQSRKYAENQKAPYPFFGWPGPSLTKFWLWISEFPAALVNFYGAYGRGLIGNARLAARPQMTGNSLRCRQDSEYMSIPILKYKYPNLNQFSVPHLVMRKALEIFRNWKCGKKCEENFWSCNCAGQRSSSGAKNREEFFPYPLPFPVAFWSDSHIMPDTPPEKSCSKLIWMLPPVPKLGAYAPEILISLRVSPRQSSHDTRVPPTLTLEGISLGFQFPFPFPNMSNCFGSRVTLRLPDSHSRWAEKPPTVQSPDRIVYPPLYGH